MGSKPTALLFLVAALAFAGSALASETIYKWTDADGNVHYGDRPSGAPSEERLVLTYQRTDQTAVQGRIQARLDRQAERDEARAQREEDKQEAADEAAAAAERQQACADARDRLDAYLESRRLYRTDANGERVYLDDAARDEAQRKAAEKVTELCS